MMSARRSENPCSVGRTPWSARDPLVPLSERSARLHQADEGVGRVCATNPAFLIRFTAAIVLTACAALAQPGQPAPAQPSAMRDSDSKGAPLPAALAGVSIDQRLNAP